MKKYSEIESIALYSLFGHGEHLKVVSEYVEEDEDYVRLTEPLEVQFVYLPDEVVVPEKINSLKIKIEDIRTRMTADIAAIEEQISKLQAITFQPENNDD